MKNIIIFSILIGFFACNLLGCATQRASDIVGGTTNSSTIIQEYFPSNVGYTWIYQGNDGTFLTCTFEGISNIGDNEFQKYITFKSLSSDYLPDNTYGYRYSDNTVYYYDASFPVQYYWIPLVFPLEIGKTWPAYHTPDNEQLTALVIGTEEVTTPAGTFHCFKIGYTKQENSVTKGTDYIWLGKNVGKVKFTASYGAVEYTLINKSF
ncbi:MAG: hypothetical protein WC500_06310 [Candidatus Margulisiibacteriota bacterium]